MNSAQVGEVPDAPRPGRAQRVELQHPAPGARWLGQRRWRHQHGGVLLAAGQRVPAGRKITRQRAPDRHVRAVFIGEYAGSGDIPALSLAQHHGARQSESPEPRPVPSWTCAGVSAPTPSSPSTRRTTVDSTSTRRRRASRYHVATPWAVARSSSAGSMPAMLPAPDRLRDRPTALQWRAVVGQRPACERRSDEVCDVLGFVRGIEEQVPAVDSSPGELAVHLASRLFVGEPVALPCPYAFDASLERR